MDKNKNGSQAGLVQQKIMDKKNIKVVQDELDSQNEAKKEQKSK